jgi:hypothetical protein
MTNQLGFCYQSYVKMCFLAQFPFGLCSGHVRGCAIKTNLVPNKTRTKIEQIQNKARREVQVGILMI